MSKKDKVISGGERTGTLRSRFRQQRSLQVILLLGLLYLAVFAYVPMVGIIIAFKDYKLTAGLMGFFTSDWVGFKWFIEFFSSPMCFKVVRNTLVLSLLKLLIAFPAPILFALMKGKISAGIFQEAVFFKEKKQPHGIPGRKGNRPKKTVNDLKVVLENVKISKRDRLGGNSRGLAQPGAV